MKSLHIKDYENFIYDCDGVILDSNKVKEINIEKAAKNYLAENNLSQLLNYFNANPGIPRELKLNKFIKDTTLVNNLLNDYNKLNLNSLKKVKIVNGFELFIKKVYKYHKNIFVVSGGDQAELLEILQFKNLTKYFTKILGGPNTKEENINKLSLSGNTLYFGDSQIDYNICKKHNFDFVFISGYTDFQLDLNLKSKIKIYQANSFIEI